MIVSRGTRDKVEKYFDISQSIKFKMQIDGRAVYDFCCFGLDKDNRLSDDRYMVFYNQTSSPSNEIIYSSVDSFAEFTINLNKLPESIQKLVFTASIDGAGTMGEIASHKISISQNSKEIIEAEFKGSDFHQEKAITAIEIYRKNGWRFNVIARGFDGGLDVLLTSFGGELVESEAGNTKQTENKSSAAKSNEIETPKKISLEKKIQNGAPKLISLVKPLKVELEKRNLQDITARVALVLDISGSMEGRYANGTVQNIVNKILPLAVQFDDDGELDLWYYGSKPKRMPSVNMSNYENAVPISWESLMTSLGYGNNEPEVMQEIINEYKDSKLHAYVIFITDGGVDSASEIESLLKKASAYPIFWQFVGVGGCGYGILETLDTMSGRLVDNANFFALDDFKSVPNEELYSRLLNEFPNWIKDYAEYKATGKAVRSTRQDNNSIKNRLKNFFGF